MRVLEKLAGVSDVAVFGGGLHVTVSDRRERDSENPHSARAGWDQRNRLEPIEPSMEDVFVAMIEAGREESRMNLRRLEDRDQEGTAAHRARCRAA